jgi:hypothetical protein
VIGIFKQKAPGNIALLFIFGLLIKLPLFLYPKKPVASAADGKLYRAMLQYLEAYTPLLTSMLAFALLYIQALQLIYLMNEYRMTSRQNYLAGMAYLLITSLLPEWNYLSAALISTTLVIWAFIKLFDLYNVEKGAGKIFNIGLMIGLSSFFYFPSVFFALSILIGLLVLRPFRLNELFLMVTGILTPYYFFAVYLFLTDRLTLQQLPHRLEVFIPPLKNSVWIVGATLLIGIPFLVGGYFIQVHLRKMLIQTRKNWSVMLLFLLLAIFIPFINNTQTYQNWMVVAAPFAAFHACTYLYPIRRWPPLLLFFAFVAFIITQQYFSRVWQG